MNYKYTLILKFIKKARTWPELNQVWALINKIDDEGLKSHIKDIFFETGSLLTEKQMGDRFE